jgi:ubiquinone biosynthesis accessory factor UbiK
MDNPASNPLDEVVQKVLAAVPGSLGAMRADLESNLRAVLQSALARLDLVTRQEFDVQAAVLARAREKLAALEARIAALEAAEPGSG